MINKKKYEYIITSEPLNLVEKIPAKFDLHWHHYNEILVYPPEASSRRKPVVLVDQTTYELKPGDALLIWSSEMHSIISNPDMVLMGIQFPPSILTDIPEFASFAHLFRSYHLLDADDTKMSGMSEYIQLKMKQILDIHKQKNSAERPAFL